MKILFILFTILFNNAAQSQNTLIIYDISQKQLQLIEQYKDLDSISRSKLIIDSIYNPYKEFWQGYLGNANDVAEWMNGAMAKFPEWQQKNKTIDGTKLLKQFLEVSKNMTKITGYLPAGKWYILYGPAWTDLGGLGDFAMLIDLAHESNSSNERILRMFPHELTHQIMTNVNKHKDSSAISSIIGEGFAVWMNQKYWKEKYTLAQNLGFTDTELQECEKSIDKLKKFLHTNKYSTDKNVIDAFRNRSTKLNENLPGAIGYYFGYKIVEAYVQKFGIKSWKDIFVKSPKEIFEMSGFLE